MDNYTKLFNSLEDYNNSSYIMDITPNVCKIKTGQNENQIRYVNAIFAPINNNISDSSLIMWLDAIDNMGIGQSHSNSTLTWYNLAYQNNSVHAIATKMIWEDDHLAVRKNSNSRAINLGMFYYKEFTLELVLSINYSSVYNTSGYYPDILSNQDSGGFRFTVWTNSENTNLYYLRITPYIGGVWTTKSWPEYLLKYGEKYYIVLVFSNSNKSISLYINGRLISTFTWTSGGYSNPSHNDVPLAIGANPGVGNSVGTSNPTISADYYAIRLYTKLLAESEIVNNYKYYKNRFNIPIQTV